MMRRQFLGTLGLCCAIGLVASGCGGEDSKEVKVTGGVKQGGKALSGVSVSFIPADGKGTGKGARTDADGKFALTMLPGSYKVVLTKLVDKKGNVPQESENPAEDLTQLEASGYLRHALPAMYASPDHTPLKAEIPPEGKDLETFELTK